MAEEKQVKEESKEEKKSDSAEATPDSATVPAGRQEATSGKPGKEEKAAEKPEEEAKPEATAGEGKLAEAPKEKAKAEAPKVEEKKPEAPKKEEPKVELSKEAKQIVDTLKNMSVLEVSKLVKELESVFGVSAAAPVMAAGAPAAGAPAEAEEKTSFDVVLTAAGDKKIQVIKEVRTITGLGLKEAKAVVDSAPKPVKQGVNKEEADKIKAQLEGAGATVEVK